MTYSFFFSSRRRHTRCSRDWSSDVCSSDLLSNHGGRQLDSCVAPIEVLPQTVRALGERLPILIDSGFRRGTDILKRSEEHTSELQSRLHLVCRLLLEKKKQITHIYQPQHDTTLDIQHAVRD